MKIHRHWMASILLIAVLAVGISLAREDSSQRKVHPQPEAGVFLEREELILDGQGPETALPVPPELAIGKPNDVTFSFISSEMSFGGKVVKSAPYSAEAITETVQTLSDGNRISRKSTATVYRDSEGRTRRDQTLGAIGPWAAAGEPPQMTSIQDPVAGANWVLDPRTHTARKLPLGRMNAKSGPAPEMIPPLPTAGPAEASHDVLQVMGVKGIYYEATAEKKKPARSVPESLGKQMIEGVEAEGTRSTVTIPAGEIGNELPIQIVSERWYSPQLQIVVMSKHYDPRLGETTYRLTNINRSEPASSLFEVPSDYTIKEGPATFERRIWRNKKPAETN